MHRTKKIKRKLAADPGTEGPRSNHNIYSRRLQSAHRGQLTRLVLPADHTITGQQRHSKPKNNNYFMPHLIYKDSLRYSNGGSKLNNMLSLSINIKVQTSAPAETFTSPYHGDYAQKMEDSERSVVFPSMCRSTSPAWDRWATPRIPNISTYPHPHEDTWCPYNYSTRNDGRGSGEYHLLWCPRLGQQVAQLC